MCHGPRSTAYRTQRTFTSTISYGVLVNMFQVCLVTPLAISWNVLDGFDLVAHFQLSSSVVLITGGSEGTHKGQADFLNHWTREL